MNAPERQREYSSPLIRDLETERRRVFDAARNHIPVEQHLEFFEYSKQMYITKFCQMGLNRRWHDSIRTVKADLREEAKRMVERSLGIAMPDMEPELWDEEDVKVFQAIKAAEESQVKAR